MDQQMSVDATNSDSNQTRQSIFDGVFSGHQVGDGINIWSEIHTNTMPWYSTPLNQIPDLVRFTGAGDDTLQQPTNANNKRKSDEFHVCDFTRPSKIQATDELMAAQMKNMSIQNEEGNKNSQPNSTADVNFNTYSQIQISGDVIPSLEICPEIKGMDVFEPLMGTSPSPAWCNLEKSSKALVLWKPPKYPFAHLRESLVRSKSCSARKPTNTSKYKYKMGKDINNAMED